MDADRAARRIVSAMRRRQPEVILTPAAQLGARGAALFPGLTARVLHLAAAALQIRLMKVSGSPWAGNCGRR